VAGVAAAFRRALVDPPGAPVASADGLLGALLGLHANNISQWALEDSARFPGATDPTVAEAKRGIDRLNLARHHFVERVDELVTGGAARLPGARPATEGPGMAFDRLSVLVIRMHHTDLAGRGPGPAAASYAARLPALREQLDWLEGGIEQLLSDLRDGTRYVVPYRHLKLYGHTDPAPPA
jgi:hypothetical protein